MAQNRLKPTLTLLSLIAIFVIPSVLATWLYRHHSLEGRKTTNNGHFIIPPKKLSKLQTQQPSSRTLKPNGKWTLILFEKDQCNSKCQKSLYFLRQIQKASGKNQDRVARLVISFKPLGKTEPETRQGITTPQKITKLLGKNPAGTFYIADPLGNLMMRYPPNTTYMAIYKDLKHLLQVSQIG